MKNKTHEIASAKESKNMKRDSTSPLLNLPSIIAIMKQSKTWAKGELNTMILQNSSKHKIVLTMLHSDTEILSFQGGHSTTFQVIEGALTFLNHNRSVFIEKGELLTDYDKLAYKLSNALETVFLITTDHKNN